MYLSGGLTLEQHSDVYDIGLWKAVNDTYVNDKLNFEHINFWKLTKSERKKRLRNFKKLIIVRDRVKNSLRYAADVSRFMMRFLGFVL